MAEQSLEQIAEEIERAHVICIVFSVDRQDTLSKIGTYWLPFVRENCNNDERKPVILVGNKIDLIDYSIIDVSNTLKLLTSMHIFSPISKVCMMKVTWVSQSAGGHEYTFQIV